MQRKVLVVDDEPDVVELLSFSLKKAGYAVGTATNGLEALSKARSIAPDLILLDLMLPELDGISVCEILRRNAATSCIPIIMITARSGELAKIAGLESGANDYI